MAKKKEPSIRDMIAKIAATNDQDRAAAADWVKATPRGDVLAIWLCIQDMPDHSPFGEISRLAQLALGELIVEHLGKEDE